MKHLCLHLRPRFFPLLESNFHKKCLLNWWGRTKQLYVLLALEKCNFATSFDLWMSKNVHNIFALMINFLGTNWQLKNVTFGLFEAIDIFGKILVKNLIKSIIYIYIYIYNFKKMIIVYVKDKGFNSNTMINV
jgi:hypothetical protein